MATTGLISKRCYAARYRDCDGGRATREHWISKALLERIQDDGTGLRVTGLSWCEGEREIRGFNLVSRVLCARHNHMLHELDDAIVALHDAWLGVGKGNTAHSVIQGELLERWALKVLVGWTVSGAVRIDGVKATAQPPSSVLDIVFGLRDLPPPRGFYFLEHDDREDGLKLKVIAASTGHDLEGIALGITIQFVAFRFLTWLNAAPPGGAPVFIYRPAGIDFGPLGRIEFQWKLGAGSVHVPIDLRVT